TVTGGQTCALPISTATLLALEEPPSAIVFDSDEMALAGIHVVEAAGVRIPEDIAVASYEDSALTRTHRPPITAIGRSATEYGRVAATRLLEVIQDGDERRASPAEARAI